MTKAQRAVLETDDQGRLKSIPILPPSAPVEALTADERSQIVARLRLSPSERLRYLEDMIAFEELARHARHVI